MAFTRQRIKDLLKECGVEEIPKELLTALMDAHTETQEEVVSLKLQKQKEELESNSKPVDVKEHEDYLKLAKEYEDFKTEVTSKAKTDTIVSKLKESGANEKLISKMLKDLELDKIDVEKEESVTKAIDTLKTGDWAMAFETVEVKNPAVPAHSGKAPQPSDPFLDGFGD